MKTAKSVMTTAARYIGVKESPPDSNNVIFNTDYYGGPVNGPKFPWCCAFVWDVFRMAGASSLFYNGQKTAYCPNVETWGKAAGLSVPINSGRYGDIVLFDWQHNGEADHIGLIESKNANGTYNTIEGNTAVGNDSNGGEVMRRVRNQSTICCIIRPKYEQEAEVVTYEEWKAFQKQYEREQAAKGVPDDKDEWTRKAYDFAKDTGLSDGFRPYAYVTRVEVWGMFSNFLRYLKTIFKEGEK